MCQRDSVAMVSLLHQLLQLSGMLLSLSALWVQLTLLCCERYKEALYFTNICAFLIDIPGDEEIFGGSGW